MTEEADLARQGTVPPHHNQRGRPNGQAADPDPLWTPDGNDDGSFSGLQFQREIPDEASAEAWFRAAWGQNGILPPCPRCGWDNNSVAFTSTKAVMPYWCRHCKKPFSIKIKTVMSYSPLRLRTWLQALLIWTEGDSPSSSDELERRMGLGDGTGSDVNWCILRAATENPEHLDEDCVLWWFRLGGRRKRNSGKPHVYVAILKGCNSGHTRMGSLPHPPGRDSDSLARFIYDHMSQGNRLFLDNPNLASKTRVLPHDIGEIGDESLSRPHFLQLQDKVESIFRDVYNGVSAENVDAYLAGIQWWENYGHRSHRERMKALAAGMRYKTPPESRSTRKRKRPGGKRKPFSFDGIMPVG